MFKLMGKKIITILHSKSNSSGIYEIVYIRLFVGSKDTLTTGRYIQAVRRTPDNKVSPYSPETTDSQWLQQEHISDLSVVQTVEETETRCQIQPGSSVESDSQLYPVKCQVQSNFDN